jgi:hypothetical protein
VGDSAVERVDAEDVVRGEEGHLRPERGPEVAEHVELVLVAGDVNGVGPRERDPVCERDETPRLWVPRRLPDDPDAEASEGTTGVRLVGDRRPCSVVEQVHAPEAKLVRQDGVGGALGLVVPGESGVAAHAGRVVLLRLEDRRRRTARRQTDVGVARADRREWPAARRVRDRQLALPRGSSTARPFSLTSSSPSSLNSTIDRE